MTTGCNINIPQTVEGLRPLSPIELMRRLDALECIHNKDNLKCQGQVYVNLFFDGTGNNRDARDQELNGESQEEANKHSNVARLFNAAIFEPQDGLFPYYIPGIGTKFEQIGDAGGWSTQKLGGGFGFKGADRINWGITRVFNAAHFYLTQSNLLQDIEAKSFVNNVSGPERPVGKGKPGRGEAQFRQDKYKELEQTLKKVHEGQQRKITEISIAVFGFSRGAATARAFANWFFELTTLKDGYYTLADIPVRLYFMGLFDTVASVGSNDSLPGMDGHAAWADHNMQINPAVEQCLHFIALHEQRAGFPLELAENVKQVGYPGMHSDVGGGYRPGEQGKSMPEWGASPQLSQIPLMDMYRAAMLNGVPLRSEGEIKERPKLLKDFDCSPLLVEAVKAYFDECQINSEASGAEGVMDVLHAHTLQYLRWRSTINSRQLKQCRFYNDATLGKDQERLREGVDDFFATWRDLRWHLESSVLLEANTGASRSGSELERIQNISQRYNEEYPAFIREQARRTGNPKTWAVERGQPSRLSGALQEIVIELETNTAPIPDAVRRLFEDYVHDSRAGFRIGIPLTNKEIMETGEGYFRYRHAFLNQWYSEENFEDSVRLQSPIQMQMNGLSNSSLNNQSGAP